jgi:hypothetical protein
MKEMKNFIVAILFLMTGLTGEPTKALPLPLEIQNQRLLFMDSNMQSFVKHAQDVRTQENIMMQRSLESDPILNENPYSRLLLPSDNKLKDFKERVQRALRQEQEDVKAHKKRKLNSMFSGKDRNDQEKTSHLTQHDSSLNKKQSAHETHLMETEKMNRKKVVPKAAIKHQGKSLSLKTPKKYSKKALKEIVLGKKHKTIRNAAISDLKHKKLRFKTENRKNSNSSRKRAHKLKHLSKQHSRKLNFLTNVVSGISQNMLPIGAAVAAGGLIGRHFIDKKHEFHRSNLTNLKSHLKLRMEVMDDTLGTLDQINKNLNNEASKLLIEKDMFDHRFQSKADLISKIII